MKIYESACQDPDMSAVIEPLINRLSFSRGFQHYHHYVGIEQIEAFNSQTLEMRQLSSVP
jgi:hypothetical protein